MEFWGVEVKPGQSVTVSVDEEKVLHLSQASLGEIKKDKGKESVPLFVKFNNQKLVLGHLSAEKFPQQSFDLVFEKEFELSHNCKNGSVFFTGYQSVLPDDSPEGFDDESESEDVSDEELMVEAENGKAAPKVENAKPASTKAIATKPEQPIKDVKSKESDDDNESDDDDEDGESDEDDSDDSDEEDDSGDSDEEDEETPKKADLGKKRPAESATKTPVPSKKAKSATPQKTDGKKGGHTATPHPSKKAGKAPPNGTPKSGGEFSCKSCSKTFNSGGALQSHSKAKHGGN